MHVFIDDERYPPNDGSHWVIVRDAPTAIKVIRANWERIDKISFDHDLGEPEAGTGYDVVTAIEQMVHDEQITMLPQMVVHSANPTGSARIQAVIGSIKRLAEQNGMPTP